MTERETTSRRSLADDIASRTASIPKENLIEPKASIAGPALQGLAFTHEEESLKDLYLRLIATAMDNRSSEIAHPAFVEILKQLDSDDARLIMPILRQAIPIPIVQLRTETDEGNTFSVIANHVLNIRNESNEPSANDRVPAIVDNWIRLRLVEVDYTMFFPTGDRYDWVEERPELAEARKVLYVAGTKVAYQPGVLQRTKFGEQFARAVGLLED